MKDEHKVSGHILMSLKNIFLRSLVPVLVTALCSIVSFASTKEKQKIIIGAAIESAPYIINGVGPNKGFDADLFNILFDRLDYDIEIIHGPINRLPILLEHKKIDAMITWPNASRSCAKSTPYRFWQNAILTTSDHDIKNNSLHNLKDRIVGAFPNAKRDLAQELGDHIDTFAAYFEVPSSENAAKMLLNNRFDAYIGDIWAVSYFYDIEVKKQKEQPNLIVNYLFEPNPQILCFANELTRDHFEEELANFKASGEYEALKTKYIPNLVTLK